MKHRNLLRRNKPGSQLLLKFTASNFTWVCNGEALAHTREGGEAAIRNTAIMGDGIYKSIDAGKTWRHVLTLDASATERIIVHPKKS